MDEARHDPLLETLVADQAMPCGATVAAGRLTVIAREPRPVPASLVIRPVRVSELAALERIATPAGALDRELVASGSIRVLLVDEVLVGAIGWVERGEPGRPLLRLWSVAPAQRGRRYGQQLLVAGIAELRRLGRRQLEVDAGPEAVAALVRAGFRAADQDAVRAAGTAITGVWMARALAPAPTVPIV